MKQVCRATFCLPILYVTMNFGSSEYSVRDHSRKQNSSDTGGSARDADLIIKEHESKDECGRIERGSREHQPKRWTKPRGTVIYAGENWRDTTAAQHQWRARKSREHL